MYDIIVITVVNICADETHLDELTKGRYGEEGYLFNVHYPVNPETFNGKSHDWIATIKKQKDMEEHKTYLLS